MLQKMNLTFSQQVFQSQNQFDLRLLIPKSTTQNTCKNEVLCRRNIHIDKQKDGGNKSVLTQIINHNINPYEPDYILLSYVACAII